MKYLILSLIVLSLSVSAAEKKTKSTTSTKANDTVAGTLNIEPKGKADDIVDETATITHKNVKLHVTCKTKDGHELKEGDADYKECLKKEKSDVNAKFEK